MQSREDPSSIKRLASWLAQLSAVLLSVGTFTTWLMGRGLEYRTGLDYPWFTSEYVQNLGSLSLNTVLYFAEVLTHAAVLLGVAAIVSVSFIVQRKWPHAVKRVLNPVLRSGVRQNFSLAIAAFLLVFYLLPSTQITYQLRQPALYNLNTSLSRYDVIARVSQWQQKLQVCGAVGDMMPELARRSVTCSGQYAAPAIATIKLHRLYVVYVCSVLLLLVFAIPEMRWAITSLSRRKKTAPTKTMIFDASRLAVESVPVLAIPWIYVILCAAIAPKYGIVAGSHCSGYEVPAKGGKLVLYDPVQPESANTFKEEDVAETRGPRADAFAGFLAEALDPSNLRVYRPCVLPVAKR